MNGASPKYIALSNWIEKQIIEKNMDCGQKFYSENELSEKFILSRQTVRQAVSLMEQKGMLERRRGSGTYVVYKRGASAKATMTIGVITTYLDSYIFPSIIRGIEKVLSKNNYSMQLAFTYNKVENEKKALLAMMEKNVDGLIVEPTKSVLPNPNMELYHEITKRNLPLIFLHAYYPNVSFPHVTMDDHLAGFTATEYLLKKGHRKISGIFQMDDLQGHKRYAGYVDALKLNNIDVDANKVIWFSTEDIKYLPEDFGRVMRCLKGNTAMLCYNDQIAFTVATELEKHGLRVPSDISIVGVDNSHLSTISKPQITTVEHPMDKLGKKAAENLIGLINDPQFNATYEFKTSLIERESVLDLNELFEEGQ